MDFLQKFLHRFEASHKRTSGPFQLVHSYGYGVTWQLEKPD